MRVCDACLRKPLSGCVHCIVADPDAPYAQSGLIVLLSALPHSHHEGPYGARGILKRSISVLIFVSFAHAFSSRLLGGGAEREPPGVRGFQLVSEDARGKLQPITEHREGKYLRMRSTRAPFVQLRRVSAWPPWPRTRSLPKTNNGSD